MNDPFDGLGDFEIPAEAVERHLIEQSRVLTACWVWYIINLAEDIKDVMLW